MAYPQLIQQKMSDKFCSGVDGTFCTEKKDITTFASDNILCTSSGYGLVIEGHVTLQLLEVFRRSEIVIAATIICF